MTKKNSTILISVIIIGILSGILIWTGIFIWNLKPKATIIVTKPEIKDTLTNAKNDWTPHTTINITDTNHVVEVTYDQKYGRTVQIYCMAVFENKKENRYKCIAPWLGKKEIERANINDFQTKIILKSEVPESVFMLEESLNEVSQ